MLYKTLDGKEYTPVRKLVLTVTPEGRYEINLPLNSKITYKDRESFEKSLENKTNKFYCHICRDFNFISRLLEEKNV